MLSQFVLRLGNCSDGERLVPSVQVDIDTAPMPDASLEKSDVDWKIPESRGPLYVGALEDPEARILGATAANDAAERRRSAIVLRACVEKSTVLICLVKFFSCLIQDSSIKALW